MMETIDYQGHTLRKWQKGSSTFLACPELGARLMNWHLTMADGSVRDVIYWPEDADFSNIAHVRGGNPVLFPFSGRMYDNGIAGEWKAPKEENRIMPQHGFARDGHFDTIEADDLGFIGLLKPTPEAKEAYPYDYEFKVAYRFYELSIQVDFRLENLGKKPIPWSGGHHFYFNLPWSPGLSRDDYSVFIPTNRGYYHKSNGLLEPVEVPSERTSFGDPALSDRIHSNLKGNTVTFGPKDGGDDITIRILEGSPDSALDTMVTWTEDDNSPFYCVEPWMTPPNPIENNTGPVWVQPNEISTFSVEVKLD